VPRLAGMSFRSHRAGRRHLVFLTTSGDVVTWGDNHDGQCGVENLASPVVALPQVVYNAAGRHKMSSVGAGDYHSLALTEQGVLYCWGASYNGQCALASGALFTYVPTPVAMPYSRTVTSMDGGAKCGR
jgi:regulator of chromosome condensation